MSDIIFDVSFIIYASFIIINIAFCLLNVAYRHRSQATLCGLSAVLIMCMAALDLSSDPMPIMVAQILAAIIGLAWLVTLALIIVKGVRVRGEIKARKKSS